MFDLDTIMATELVTATPSTSLYRAREMMREHRIRHLPVVDEDNRLVGLVTWRAFLWRT
jgi:acetoin utilization protein AcuB